MTRRRPARRSNDSGETQIANRARDGLSNAQIGARLFISPRTLEHHLDKLCTTKLDITSREHLHRVLPTR
jgi:DNA-binding CsgD family transcriptional regulator